MSDLEQIFFDQEDFQRSLAGGVHPSGFPMDQRIQFIKDMVLAATDELHELLDEVGWKPWATSRHINVDPAKAELVDVLCFFINLCLAVGYTPEELANAHAAKMVINRRRQIEGYTGLNKCPGCKRALDDPTTIVWRAGKWLCSGCGYEFPEAKS